MLEYGVHKDFYLFLNLEKNPKMHWTNTSNWAMVQHMHGIVLEATKSIVGTINYLSFTYDEVSTIDN